MYRKFRKQQDAVEWLKEQQAKQKWIAELSDGSILAIVLGG